MRTYAWLYSSCLILLSLASASLSQAATNEAASRSVASSLPTVRVTVENPREINVGKAATFTLGVANEGKTTANQVVVIASMPQHAEMASATPEPTKVEGGSITFQIGNLLPGASRRITLIAIPQAKQPITLNAKTTFETSTQASVVVRQPVLKLTAQVPPQAGIGTEVDWLVRATNVGDGQAEDIVVTPHLIEGLVEGKTLEQAVKIGSLKPGETKELQFTVVPSRRGKLAATFTGSNSDGLEAKEQSAFQVLQAHLAVAAVGPVVQPLAREGSYEIQVTNPGDATAGSTLVVVNVPAGLEVTAAAEHAYDRSTRTLRWRITKVRPSDIVRLPFRAETTAAGDQTLKVVAQSKGIEDAAANLTTAVISRSNLIVTVVNDQELAPVAAPVGFKVTVINAGSKRVEDLRVRVAMPDGLKAVNSASYEVADGEIVFPVQKLASGEKVTLAFQAMGSRVGEHRVRVLVNGGALTRELTFEGSTYCYSNDEVPVKATQPGNLPTSVE